MTLNPEFYYLWGRNFGASQKEILKDNGFRIAKGIKIESVKRNNSKNQNPQIWGRDSTNEDNIRGFSQ